jgi:hypothetical protein
MPPIYMVEIKKKKRKRGITDRIQEVTDTTNIQFIDEDYEGGSRVTTGGQGPGSRQQQPTTSASAGAVSGQSGISGDSSVGGA